MPHRITKSTYSVWRGGGTHTHTLPIRGPFCPLQRDHFTAAQWYICRPIFYHSIFHQPFHMAAQGPQAAGNLLFPFCLCFFSVFTPIPIHAGVRRNRDELNDGVDLIAYERGSELPPIPHDVFRFNLLRHLTPKDMHNFGMSCRAYKALTHSALIEHFFVTQEHNPVRAIQPRDRMVFGSSVTPQEAAQHVARVLEDFAVGTLHLRGVAPATAAAILDKVSSRVHDVYLVGMHITPDMPLARFNKVILEGGVTFEDHVTLVQTEIGNDTRWQQARESLCYAKHVELRYVTLDAWHHAFVRVSHVHCFHCVFNGVGIRIAADNITLTGCNISRIFVVTFASCTVNFCRLSMSNIVYASRASLNQCILVDDDFEHALLWLTIHEGVHSFVPRDVDEMMSVEVAGGVARVLL